ncbi:MAG: YggS family pyridoxal phosphate-dependent enzyme [Chitinophagaceae bacterium]|nr:YggS family pyridoxal phosphate-dependent enzyme [Chitinophagaceae bacterium]
MIMQSVYRNILSELGSDVQLVAVSKTKPIEDIRALYDLGQKDFGENYVQELVDKHSQLPADIRWHFIGHLQSNKVKYIASFVHLIHGVDSLRLLKEINKQAARQDRVIACLLQVHIAREETKFGLDATELDEALQAIRTTPGDFTHIRIRGLMGMASFTEDQEKVRDEFKGLKALFDEHFGPEQAPPDQHFLLSMGMSGDYRIAVREGGNMVRIGSLLFGKRV